MGDFSWVGVRGGGGVGRRGLRKGGENGVRGVVRGIGRGGRRGNGDGDCGVVVCGEGKRGRRGGEGIDQLGKNRVYEGAEISRLGKQGLSKKNREKYEQKSTQKKTW